MLADRVVEHLDVIEHILPGFFARFIGASPDALTFEGVEKLSATALSWQFPRRLMECSRLGALVKADKSILMNCEP